MKRVLSYLERKDVHPLVQFGKYGIVGGIAVVVDIICFYALALFVFPSLTEDDRLAALLASGHAWLVQRVPSFAAYEWLYDLTHWHIRAVAESERSINYVLDRTLVFFTANLVAYALNVAWVFTPGRHAKHREIALYLLVAIASFVVGTTIGTGLIALWAMDTSVAVACNIAAAVAINFVLRKYWVFLR
jgi:putative flippase GtrA